MARLGWDSPLALVGRVHVPGGAIPRSKRALLRRTPVVIPTEGWVTGSNIDEPPDWAWRTSLVKYDAGLLSESLIADAASNRTLTLKISGKTKDAEDNEIEGSLLLSLCSCRASMAVWVF